MKECEGLNTVKDDLKEIKCDIKEIKTDLATHMSRTALNEQRIEHMEEFAKAAMDSSQKNFELMLQSNKDSLAAQNRQLKIILGVFAGLAALVTAFAAFFA
jgi:DNA anti-recombination protein RmuC